MDNTIGVPHQVLTQDQVDILYEILQRFDAVAYKSGLNYSIACGTVLGAVLRGGLIPWDEDADLFVHADEFIAHLPELVRNAESSLIIKKYTRWSDGRGWYKIYHPRAPYPNVDLYLLEFSPAENVWRPSDAAIKWRRGIALDSDQVVWRDRIQFGPLHLSIFSDPIRFLDRCYGSKWRQVAKKADVESQYITGVSTDFRPSLPTQRAL
jgi:lipopolysaccharide cholinephosphotransferase